MGSAFFEFNIAVSGLFAAQHGLNVTSNNINNALTPGYSRQLLYQKASPALGGQSVGMVGTGVTATHIARVRNSYLDMKIWNQNDSLGEYRVKTEQNALIEGVFGEPSDAGFTKIFNDVFKSIDDLSKLPSERERKEAMKQMIKSFTKYFNSASESLKGFQRDLNFEVRAKVDEINMLTTRVESLNREIYQAELGGAIANSLRDDRELCVDRLSQLINVDAKEVQEVGADGKLENHFVIKANGQTLVDHYFSRQLTVETRLTDDKKNPEDADGLYDVRWSDGLPFDMGDSKLSGELKGVIDMRDGRGTASFPDGAGGVSTPDVTYNGIPYYRSKLDKFSSIFSERMNEIYSKDVDKDIELTLDRAIDPPITTVPPLTPSTPGPPPTRGTSIYKRVDGDGNATYYAKDGAGNKVPLTVGGNPLNAAQIQSLETASSPRYKLFTCEPTGPNDNRTPSEAFRLDENIEKDSNYIRTNYAYEIDFTTDPPTVTNPNESANDLFLELLQQKDNSKMFNEGDPKDYMISMFSELGINAKEAKMYLKTQENITNVIENQRLAVSQVDLNEEFMNLVKYNQAYQAAAKLINTIDNIYETTIMRLGSF